MCRLLLGSQQDQWMCEISRFCVFGAMQQRTKQGILSSFSVVFLSACEGWNAAWKRHGATSLPRVRIWARPRLRETRPPRRRRRRAPGSRRWRSNSFALDESMTSCRRSGACGRSPAAVSKRSWQRWEGVAGGSDTVNIQQPP